MSLPEMYPLCKVIVINYIFQHENFKHLFEYQHYTLSRREARPHFNGFWKNLLTLDIV